MRGLRLPFRRRRPPPPSPPREPPSGGKDLLWDRIELLFTPEDGDGWNAGPDVEVTPLSPGAIQRMWDLLLSLGSQSDREHTMWHDGLEREVRLADVRRLTTAKFGVGSLGAFYTRLYDVRFRGVELPPLGVWVSDDSIAIHWWCSNDEGWAADTAAALVELLDEIRRSTPDAQFELEWDGTEHGFAPSVEEYLRSR